VDQGREHTPLINLDVPEIAELLSLDAHPQSFFIVVGPHEIEHQHQVVAHLFLHFPDDRHVFLAELAKSRWESTQWLFLGGDSLPALWSLNARHE
jgi:hypothetical protein